MDIVAAGNAGAVVNGITMDFVAIIRNVFVKGFSGHGISIETVSGLSNSNNWRIDDTRCESNLVCGLYVEGVDSNAGVATNLDCSSNGTWGIWDSSFLGNTYIGCHTQGNVTGGYKGEGSVNETLFLNCYTEAGQGSGNVVDAPCMWLGGIGAGPGGTARSISGRASDYWNVAGGLEHFLSDGTSSIIIGRSAAADIAMALKYTSEGEYRLSFATDAWVWRHDGLGSLQPWAITTTGATEGPGNLRLNKGFSTGKGQPPIVSTVPIDGTAYGSVGTDTIVAANDRIYHMNIWIPINMTLTGIAVLNGTTVGTDKWVYYLASSGGTVVAQTAAAGTTTSGADAFQKIAFTAAYAAAGPGKYFIGIQGNGTTDKLRTVPANYFGLTAIETAAQAFGAETALTPGTSLTAGQGPVAYVY